MKSTSNTANVAFSEELTERILDALSLNFPCIVYGSTGKTELVKHACPDAVICDSREISDPKVLGGCYAVQNCQIKYTQGVLLCAMKAGRTICFKRIDLNTRLLHHLRPVIHDRRLTDENNETVHAHPNFQLLFTSAEPFPLHSAISIGPVQHTLSDTLASFGALEPVITELLHHIARSASPACSLQRNTTCDSVCLRKVSSCTCTPSFLCSSSTSILCSTHFQVLCDLRDILLRLYDPSTQIVSTNAGRALLLQAVLNTVLEHPSSQLLEHLSVTQQPLILNDMELAKTEPVDETLRALLTNICARKPTLLVGETGAGKTALIQYIARHSEFLLGKKVSLKVVNMSSDTDISDLLGGYYSIDVDGEIRKLYTAAGLKMPVNADRRGLLEALLRRGIEPEKVNFYLNVLKSKTPFCFREGVLTKAMREGTWLLLDEVNLAPEETLCALEALLARRELLLYESGCFDSEPVHEDFMVFACMNPFGDFGKKSFNTRVFRALWFRDFSYSLSCIRAVTQSVARNRLNQVDQLASFFFDFKKAISTGEYSNIIEPLVSGRTFCRALHLMLQLQREGYDSVIYRALSLLFFTQLDLPSRGQAVLLFKKHFGALPDDLLSPKRFADAMPDDYVVTPKIQLHIQSVELAIASSLPVLLQGDTSTGKTSLVAALSQKYERKVIRINNHEHTDASDYIGTYTTQGDRIVFREGPLLHAMRSGCWVILDELNLAPSDVLEVLNRLLDDNRELYVPELDETVRPHPDFRIFATQNLKYAGRRGLAKSLRNRFVEIFFGEKDDDELRLILSERFKLPSGFISHMLGVYSSLRAERSFDTLMTLRDLFRWARRSPTGYCHLHSIGLDLLVPRQRTVKDKNRVKEILDSAFNKYLKLETDSPPREQEINGIVMTRSYRQLVDLLRKAWGAREAVLVVGPTGIGKTKVVSAVAQAMGLGLRSLNVHSGTENSDFVGHQTIQSGEVAWRDGVLVTAMREGSAFLVDEINLTDDAILERLNSLLEDSRTIFIPETSSEVVAHPNFRIAATMNPGGDFGKRELSPALRNRFTEIYFEPEDDECLEVFGSLLGDLPDSEFFVRKMSMLTKLPSIRKIELAAECIRRVSGAERASTAGCSVVPLNSSEEVWLQTLDLLGEESKRSEKLEFSVLNGYFGIEPYFLEKITDEGDIEAAGFNVRVRTALLNMRRVLRGICLGRPVLLQGPPGVGKTAMIGALGAALGKQVVRVNLSEQTEMSDLVGTYVPAGSTIRFMESDLVGAVRNGGWVILDEINLCTQSVIEGLNGLLDHRRSIQVDDETVEMHENTRIFGTMNPSNDSNGRKHLPKSFTDRFIAVEMLSYGSEDVACILRSKYGPDFLMDPSLSLRGNIKINELKLTERECCLGLLREELFYWADSTVFATQGTETRYHLLDSSYVIIHSQIPQLDTLLRALHRNLPVILTGSTGRGAMIRFVAALFGLSTVPIDCSAETDTCDLLGQYQKTEAGDTLFEWRESPFVEALQKKSLVVFNQPELVDRAVFDRLNGIFEFTKHISVFERGLDSHVPISPECRIILCSDDPSRLSSPLLDRCVFISLSDSLSYIDYFKIFASSFNSNLIHSTLDKARLFVESKLPVSCSSLDISLRKFLIRNQFPDFLSLNLAVSHVILEEEIDNMFPVPEPSRHTVEDRIVRLYQAFKEFESPLPRNYKERTDMLQEYNTKNRYPVLPLLKLIDFADSSFNVPMNLTDYKSFFLSQIKSKKLCDLKEISEFVAVLLQTGSHEKQLDKLNWEEVSELLTDEDPLLVYRRAVDNEWMLARTEVLKDIQKTVKGIYKYGIGFGRLRGLITEHDNLKGKYEGRLGEIDRRMRRPYSEFKSLMNKVVSGEVQLQHYCSDGSLRQFLQEFSDISDRVFLELWRTQGRYAVQCSETDYARLLYHGIHTERLGDEYSKWVYMKVTGCECDTGAFVLEGLLTDDQEEYTVENGMKNNSRFKEDELNMALSSLFPIKTTAKVIETRVNKILISPDLPVPSSLFAESIFISPEKLINIISEMKIKNEKKMIITDVESAGDTVRDFLDEDTAVFLESLVTLYKQEGVLDLERNYRYFRFFLNNTPTEHSLERYFMDATVYEFLDRIFFAQEFLRVSPTPLLYNQILRFKAFEIEETHTRKLKETKIKLMKAPALYESILREYTDFWLLRPVTSLLEIRFAPPECQGTHEWRGPAGLLRTGASQDECAAWVELSRTFKREAILHKIQSSRKILQNLINIFYQRNPEIFFSYSEICLSKVLNFIVENVNKNAYSEEDKGVILALLEHSISYPFPPFLYFVYRFADCVETELEQGTGLKSGTGEAMIEDEVEDVPEGGADDREVGDEGQDIENQGELYDASTGDEGEEAVDEEDNSGTDSEEDGEDRGSAGEAELSVSGDSEGTGEETGGSGDAEEEIDEVGAAEYIGRETSASCVQTCDCAEGYERRVQGESLDERAQVPDEGDEAVEGKEAGGSAAPHRPKVAFRSEEADVSRLVELLRAVLASNRNSKYRGDFKAGKKLNMKRIVPYIASDFRKDRIWMRRQKCDKTEYKIRLFIDNSSSMRDQRMVDALSSVYWKLTRAFSILGVPVELYCFGSGVRRCSVGELSFADESTGIEWVDEFTDGVNIVLTDGIFQRCGSVRENFLVMMLDRGQLRRMSRVSMVENSVFVEKYLDVFPLKYCIVEDVAELESAFVSSLGELIRNMRF